MRFGKKLHLLLPMTLLLLVLTLALGGTSLRTEAASKKKYPTVYKGVDYSRVYNFKYYMKKYPAVKKKVGGSPKKALRYFVRYGMKKQHQAIKTFNVRSYRYGNPSLRKKYRLNYKKYYLYYLKTGYKKPSAKRTRTGVKKMVSPAVIYGGIDYSALYDYFYYTKHNPDVVRAYKDDDYAVLAHFVNYGRAEGRRGIAPSSAFLTQDSSGATASSITIDSCRISGSYVVLKATVNDLEKGTEVYLFAVPSYISRITSQKAKASKKVSGTSLTFRIPLALNTAGSVLQSKFLLAVRNGTAYKNASNSYFIQNPEAASSNKKAFPTPARGTKKGLKSVISSDEFIDKCVDLKCSHVAADFPIEMFLGGTGFSYTYEGKTYQFSNTVSYYQKQLKKLRSHGIVVTGIFYLSNRNMTKYMLPSAARGNRSRSAIFSLNTKTETRKELEALFSCLAETWTKDEVLVANWVFGNESDQYRFYNYSGDITRTQYINNYCDAFRLFNTAVKSKYANARTYICFDHNWNLSFDLEGTYQTKKLLADIDRRLKKQGGVHWDISLHPYPSPEQDPRIWNRSSLVSDSANTQQYTMLNMRYIAKYIKQTYGNGVHIILPETGISSLYKGNDMQDEQAASVAFNYYLAEFDPNIDMIIIHREKNDPAEVGWSLGLYGSSFSKPKKAANVFRYMDTPDWNTCTKAYVKKLGEKATWAKKVPGFNATRFTKY